MFTRDVHCSLYSRSTDSTWANPTGKLAHVRFHMSLEIVVTNISGRTLQQQEIHVESSFPVGLAHVGLAHVESVDLETNSLAPHIRCEASMAHSWLDD